MSKSQKGANAPTESDVRYHVNNDKDPSHSLAHIVGARRGIDPDRAAKMVRGKLRANFAKVIAADPSVSRVKSSANDGNRWPTLNEAAAQYALTARNAPVESNES